MAIGWFVLSAREQSGFVVPPIDGYMEGHKIRFIHTEASDPEVAKLLTQMKGSPVLLVPSLAKVPPDALADVYVFTNGVKGEGPTCSTRRPKRPATVRCAAWCWCRG